MTETTETTEFLASVARDAHSRSVREAENARDGIAKLIRDLMAMRDAIEDGTQPHATMDGDTGIVKAAMSIQRHVDSWITHAQAEAILIGGQ